MDGRKKRGVRLNIHFLRPQLATKNLAEDMASYNLGQKNKNKEK
jgi:hypothetical protein